MLEAAGLDAAEEEVYRLLVNRDGADPDTVAAALGTRADQTRHLLESLHAKGLVSRVADGDLARRRRDAGAGRPRGPADVGHRHRDRPDRRRLCRSDAVLGRRGQDPRRARVLRSADGGGSWESFSAGLGNPDVTSLALDARGRYLFAGTLGGSVHRIVLPR